MFELKLSYRVTQVFMHAWHVTGPWDTDPVLPVSKGRNTLKDLLYIENTFITRNCNQMDPDICASQGRHSAVDC